MNDKAAEYLYSWLNTKKNSRENSQIYLKNIFKNLDRRLKVY